MSHHFRIAFAALAVSISLTAAAALADSGKIDGFTYKDFRIMGIRDGQIVVVLSSGQELVAPFAKIESLQLNDYPRFNDAEAAMAVKDYAKAAAAYADAITKINDRKLLLVAQARSIPAFDNDGRWNDAVSAFLSVYRASPTAATFELHPTKLPAKDSRFLAESATLVAGQFTNAAFKSPEAQKSLKTFLLEIYNKMGDSRAAALAREIDGGAELPQIKAADPVHAALPPSPTSVPAANNAAPPTIAVAPVDDAVVKGIEADLAAGKLEDVIKRADAALVTGSGEGAVHLFLAKAQALQGLKKLPESAAVLMRIPVHYPMSPSAPAALLRAADIENELKDTVAAKRLYKELVDKYPTSPQAKTAAKNAT